MKEILLFSLVFPFLLPFNEKFSKIEVVTREKRIRRKK